MEQAPKVINWEKLDDEATADKLRQIVRGVNKSGTREEIIERMKAAVDASGFGCEVAIDVSDPEAAEGHVMIQGMAHSPNSGETIHF